MSTESLHPAATHHLPSFITAPGDTDFLMVSMAIILAGATLGFGVFFFRLHSLPERMAHRSQKLQMELVAVLCLISLFTHAHIFWIAGLLLALIDLPDLGGGLNRISGSLEKIEETMTRQRQAPPPEEGIFEFTQDGAARKPQREPGNKLKRVEVGPSIHPEIAPEERKERTHA